MKTHIPVFRFTLSAGQSIGPAALRSLWIRASNSVDVSVGRDAGPYGPAKPLYFLYASARLQDLQETEHRLRRLLEQAKLTVSLVALQNS